MDKNNIFLQHCPTVIKMWKNDKQRSNLLHFLEDNNTLDGVRDLYSSLFGTSIYDVIVDFLSDNVSR